ADTTSAIVVHAPSGSVFAAALCPFAVDGAIVIGSMYVQNKAGAKSGANHARVSAEWTETGADSARTVRTDVPATSDGRFRVCGIARGATVTLRGAADGATSAATRTVQFAAGTRLARAEVVLAPESELMAAGATFTGTVVLDSSGT